MGVEFGVDVIQGMACAEADALGSDVLRKVMFLLVFYGFFGS